MGEQKLTTMGVWIELQEPSDEYTAQEICDNANKMLNKLGVEGNRFQVNKERKYGVHYLHCLLYTSPSPRDKRQSRMPSSA